MQLEQSGYRPSPKAPRLSVWLTNALEPAEREVRDLFFQPLAEEARGASEVKRQTPIMCVIGNPPYSVSSENKGDWIRELSQNYKRELNEKNIQSLSDDYVKFIRLGQHHIDKNNGGILAYVTNNSYVDGIIHRRMREELSASFDTIYVFNLHGDSNKGEKAPDGSRDRNIFDIMQGVAVIVAVKGARRRTAPAVFDQFGSRPAKQEALFGGTIANIAWRHPRHEAPYYFLSNAEFRQPDVYARGFPLQDLFVESLSGAVTGNDARYVGFKSSDLNALPDASFVRPFLYRPLDARHVYYDVKKLQRAREEIFVHLIRGANMAMIAPRQALEGGGANVSDGVIGHKTFSAYHRNYVFPLYQYQQPGGELRLQPMRTLNLDEAIHTALCAAAGIDPADQAGPDDDFRAPTGDARASEVKVFDYVYGVLHAPAYRETFAEFLKIDFPRIPYPPSPQVFRHVSEAGERLRRLHLMEAGAVGDAPYPYEGEGDDVVAPGYPKYERGAVHINKAQRFESVPAVAWTHPIGGYLPAQKWLKDRRGRTLSWEDIGHYQRVVKILAETDRIMRGIDLPLAGE